MLTRDFQENEVCKALKQMYPLKAPGPDEMPPLFFQHFWPTVGRVVTKTVLDFLNSSVCPPNFNDTQIVLIPKIKNPLRITDNVLVAFETMHHISKKRTGRVG